MLPRTYAAQNCPVAAGLEVVGERWTLLILRDAFLGIRRFDDFQTRLGMSRNVLTRRLADLVEAGLLRREPYQQAPVRHDYLLTEKALELWPTLVGLGQWGGRNATAGGSPREFIHEACGTAVHATVHCPHCHVDVEPEEAGTRPGPGYRPSGTLPEALSAPFATARPLLQPVR